MKNNYKIAKYFIERAKQIEFCSLLRKGKDTTVIWVN